MVFINQSTGVLFNSLIDGISKNKDVLITGSDCDEPKSLISVKKFASYSRSSLATRIITGLKFSIRTFIYLITRKSDPIFVVTNPPFVLIVVWIISHIRGFKYSVLIYDLYPDVIVEAGILSNNNCFVHLWRYINNKIFIRSEVIFTISPGMRNKIIKYSNQAEVVDVSNWADDSIVYIKKEDNNLISKYSLNNKILLMYSGNIGLTHNVSFIAEIARYFEKDCRISFVIMGGGEGFVKLKNEIIDLQLTNVLFLDYRSNKEFPSYVAMADMGIVTLSPGFENSSVPSKTYSYLKVGAALFSVADKPNELDLIVSTNKCGISFNSNEINMAIEKIHYLLSNRDELEEMKKNSLKASSEVYNKEKSITTYDLNLRRHGII